MSLNSLQDVYVDQLQDLYSADKQSLEATRKLHEVAKHDGLRSALQDGANGIQQGIDKLDAMIRAHGADPDGEFCKGMQGLVNEAHAHALEEEFGNDDARDAMIITQFQRMTHYGIAGYGCLLAFAKRLGHQDDAAKLNEMLDNTYEGDRRMTEIATGGINEAAA